MTTVRITSGTHQLRLKMSNTPVVLAFLLKLFQDLCNFLLFMQAIQRVAFLKCVVVLLSDQFESTGILFCLQE